MGDSQHYMFFRGPGGSMS